MVELEIIRQMRKREKSDLLFFEAHDFPFKVFILFKLGVVVAAEVVIEGVVVQIW